MFCEKEMPDDLIQLVLRNRGTQGYETLYSSSDVEIEDELLPYLLPRSKTSVSFPNYYFKYPVNHDVTLVKLVQDDGVDNYNRFKAKVLLFLIPNSIYEEKAGLLYFASPLWLNTISLEKDDPLDYSKDFDTNLKIKTLFESEVNKSYLAFLLDKILFYNNVLIKIEDKSNLEQDRIFLLQALAYLDSKLPSFFRNQISIKTLTNKNYELANCVILDNNEENITSKEGLYNLSYSNKVLKADLEFESSELAKTILSSKTLDEKETISRSIFNSRTLLKEELVTNEQYNKLVKRFNVKDKKTLSRLFRSLSLR